MTTYAEKAEQLTLQLLAQLRDMPKPSGWALGECPPTELPLGTKFRRVDKNSSVVAEIPIESLLFDDYEGRKLQQYSAPITLNLSNDFELDRSLILQLSPEAQRDTLFRLVSTFPETLELNVIYFSLVNDAVQCRYQGVNDLCVVDIFDSEVFNYFQEILNKDKTMLSFSIDFEKQEAVPLIKALKAKEIIQLEQDRVVIPNIEKICRRGFYVVVHDDKNKSQETGYHRPVKKAATNHHQYSRVKDAYWVATPDQKADSIDGVLPSPFIYKAFKNKGKKSKLIEAKEEKDLAKWLNECPKIGYQEQRQVRSFLRRYITYLGFLREFDLFFTDSRPENIAMNGKVLDRKSIVGKESGDFFKTKYQVVEDASSKTHVFYTYNNSYGCYRHFDKRDQVYGFLQIIEYLGRRTGQSALIDLGLQSNNLVCSDQNAEIWNQDEKLDLLFNSTARWLEMYEKIPEGQCDTLTQAFIAMPLNKRINYCDVLEKGWLARGYVANAIKAVIEKCVDENNAIKLGLDFSDLESAAKKAGGEEKSKRGTFFESAKSEYNKSEYNKKINENEEVDNDVSHRK